MGGIIKHPFWNSYLKWLSDVKDVLQPKTTSDNSVELTVMIIVIYAYNAYKLSNAVISVLSVTDNLKYKKFIKSRLF